MLQNHQFTILLLSTLLGITSSITIIDDDNTPRKTLTPIVVIYGFGGSRLYTQDMSDSHCNTNGEMIQIWINTTHAQEAPDCYVKQFTLNYTDGRYLDAQDVTVSTDNFGSISSFADLSSFIPFSNETNFIEYLVQRGYRIDGNLRAAPYDWRLGSKQLEERGYYTELRKLVEETYKQNGNTKVSLLAISMGGPVSHYFLTEIVNQEWKDIYIHSYIPIVAAWSGASSLPALLTPPAFSIHLFFPIQASTEELFKLSRSYASAYWLSPRGSEWKDAILISTPTKNYTVSDYEELFTDAGYPQGYTQFSEFDVDWPAPNVPTYCFYSLGSPTPLMYVYGDGFPDTQPTQLIYGDGDGVVNQPSLEVCLRWANSSHSFTSSVIPSRDHFNITSDSSFQRTLGRIVGAPEDPIDVCQLPSDPGSCNEVTPRYFFNARKGACEEFTYGGCGGNSNNFETLENCNQQCNPNGCPPLCTQEYCTDISTRRSLCTLPTPQGECDAKCRITFCHTCYYADEHRALPGDCDICPYYPEVRQAVNRCFKHWAVCTRRANANKYTKARGRKEKIPQRFKCYEHPCTMM